VISLIIQGDENAFATFFHHYKNRIYGLALKLTHSTTIAEEIVQKVFLKIWLKRADLMEIQNIQAYLFTIARNDVYKVLKQIAKNYQNVLLTEEIVTENNSENYVMEKEYSTLLRKAIDHLSHQQKQVYTLIKEQGLKREEAAAFLQLHPETVKSHLAQAMKNIRNFCLLHLQVFIGIMIVLN
jgi:RNA polymerase sigma-70 factor (ECF subfamily)